MKRKIQRHLDHAVSLVAEFGFYLLPPRHKGLAPVLGAYSQYAFQRPSMLRKGIFEGFLLDFDETEIFEPRALAPGQFFDSEGVSITAFVAPIPLNAAQRINAEKQSVGDVDLLSDDAAEVFRTKLLEAMTIVEQLTATHGDEILRATATARRGAGYVVRQLCEMAPKSILFAHAQLDAQASGAEKDLATATLHSEKVPGSETDPRWVITIGWDTPLQQQQVMSAFWVAGLLMAQYRQHLEHECQVPVGAEPVDNEVATWTAQFAACVFAKIVGHEAILWES